MVASSLPIDKVIDDTLKVITTFQSKSLGSGSGYDVTPSNFPVIKSRHSLVAKHVTKDKWEKLKNIKTKTSGFTLYKAIAVSVEFDNQHCGIYAGDWDSYKDFAPVFDPLIQEYHGILPSAVHSSDMDAAKIKGNVDSDVPVHSCRIRVGRSIDGFGLSPGITKDQRVGVEKLMANAVKSFPSDLAGNYYPLTGMDEKVRQQLVDDHFLFVSGDRNLIVSNLRRSESTEITFPLPGCRYGARLARGPWNLPQRGQDLPPVGERGGPDENHLHGEGRRRQGSLLPSLSWNQGCRRLREGGIRQGICPL